MTCPKCGNDRRLKHLPEGTICRRCAALLGSKANAVKARPTALERFEAKYRVDDSGCWLWTATITPRGYGQFYLNGRIEAHRAAWELLRGPIPEGLQIDHLCRVRACVNPDHLEPVTAKINCHRGFGPSGLNASKTECSHGHAYTPENTYLEFNKVGRTKRHCRACIAVQQQASA